MPTGPASIGGGAGAARVVPVQPGYKGDLDDERVEVDADEALNRTFGNGRYQLGVFACVGVGGYSFAFPFQVMPVYTDSKMVADGRLPGFTMESLSVASSMMFFGWLVGAACVGPATDCLGRRHVVFGGMAGLILSGLAGVLAPTLGFGLAAYAAARFATGFFVASTSMASVLVQECLPGRLRGRCMAALNAAYSLAAAAQAALCGTATLRLPWQLETLLWYLPTLAGLLLGLPAVGDSVRTLAARGELKEANACLAKIARINGAQDVAKGLVVVAASPTAAGSPSVCNGVWGHEGSLTSPILLGRVASLAVCFVACSMTNYGLAYSAGALSPDLYANSAMLNLVDLLGYTLALSVDVVGRRWTQGLCFLLAAACLQMCGVLEAGSRAVVVCALVGRLCVNACFTVVYILVVELFPSGCRSRALGACCFAARLGGLFAPLSRNFPAGISCPVFGAFCAAAAFLTFQLPETSGR